MPKYRVMLTRVETVIVEADDEDAAYFAALDECEGYGELVSDYIEEIEDDSGDTEGTET